MPGLSRFILTHDKAACCKRHLASMRTFPKCRDVGNFERFRGVSDGFGRAGGGGRDCR